MHRQGRQFSRSQNEEGYNVARLRIHVERSIGRLRIFKILQFLENSLVPDLNKILIVLAYTVNNLPPLFKEESEPEETVEDVDEITDYFQTMSDFIIDLENDTEDN